MIFQSRVLGSGEKHSKVMSKEKGSKTLAGLFLTMMLLMCTCAIWRASSIIIVTAKSHNDCVIFVLLKTVL